MSRRRLRVAVVGAGLSGLAAARVLHGRGHAVAVVEKARGPGGRMSTRREADARFDHGAQYFRVRDPRFRQQVLAWQAQGLVQAWKARVGIVDRYGSVSPLDEQRYVGVPGMSAMCRELAEQLPDCRYGWRLETLRWDGAAWRLRSAAGDELEANALVMTVPPAQARALLAASGLEAAPADAEMRPCWAVMAVFDRPLLPDWGGLVIENGPLSWVADQASKPGRPAIPAWVLHANPDWSEAHLESAGEHVCEALLDAARQLPGAAAVSVKFRRAHRWRYALAREPLADGPVRVPERRLVLTGDWCRSPNVEGAFLSGLTAAGLLGATTA